MHLQPPLAYQSRSIWKYIAHNPSIQDCCQFDYISDVSHLILRGLWPSFQSRRRCRYYLLLACSWSVLAFFKVAGYRKLSLAILSYLVLPAQRSSPPECVAEIRPSPNFRDGMSCLGADLAAAYHCLVTKGETSQVCGFLSCLTAYILPCLRTLLDLYRRTPCRVQTRESLSKLGQQTYPMVRNYLA